jgi:alpha,alpha-trehalose-phosphate synthase [UDP-forming]/trehalose-phosphatase
MPADWQQLVSATSLVAAIDLDGTLVPFAPTPREAVVDADTLALLAALGDAPGVTLGVISGRPRDLVADLAAKLPRIAWCAEHGVWRFADGAWDAALPPIPQLDEIERALGVLAARHPGALVERKSCSVVLHWRRVEDASHIGVAAAAEVIVDEWLETQPALERLPGTDALEVRHRAAHKGSALAWLRGRAPSGSPVVALGDDFTDEDMFVSLREGDIGVLVGRPRRTQAGLRLPTIPAAHAFLRALVDARTGRPVQVPPELEVARPPQPPAAPNLIVASNRLPAAPTGGRTREVGGLVSALLPTLEASHGVWVGWSGAERDPGLKLRVEDTEAFVRASFDYPVGWRDKFYAGFCNRSLWPLLHGFPSRVRYVDAEWQTYVEANRAYARTLVELGKHGAEIWVQDFHLMLVARELRRTGYRGRLGFFLHVPFPAIDIFETMPWAAEVLSALLDYDRIGLQAQRHADNFIATARGVLGADAETRAKERVRVIPVGIDPDRFAECASTAPDGETLGVEAMLGGRQLILGVDRLDYSKGIPERLEAFARLLERFPEWRNQVSFVQVSVPTRSEVPEYAELRSRVEALVGRINGSFGEADWVPVRYLYRSYDQATLARLYRKAAVGLVTPLRDGMNLVAKEYVAAQDPDDPGVLVLSQFAGAAEHMTLALMTNPYHADGLAADLDTALRMPRQERVTRHGALRAIVWKDTAAAWAASFLDALRA